ncbi:septum site-determining protein Ssd [Propionibacteriaceae bacterium Y1700]|uniref:septum site-determining protein Ssd n=1 Tax=Microlunatus sp. Y1700 TaxID=3418487 RepID=UPI003DA6EE29
MATHLPTRIPPSDQAAPMIITTDEELLDRALASAAAAGVEPLVLHDVAGARRHWASASVVLVGVDCARSLAGLALPARSRVLLIGADHDQEELCRWSMTLGAAVVVLPTQLTWLAAAMAEGVTAGAPGVAVGVLGGSGGVGASTAAAGMAWRAAQQGRRVLLVDADPYGGGIDLLVGAEDVPGWRWPRLAQASGHLGDLSGQLPVVDQLEVLAMGRGDADIPSGEALSSVVRTCRQSHDLIIVDLGRTTDTLLYEGLRAIDVTTVLVADDVRGVAAGQRLVAELAGALPEPGVVVRTGPGGGVPADAVAGALELELFGELGHDRHMRVGVLHGEPPGRAAGRRWGRQCDAVLAAALAGAGHDR